MKTKTKALTPELLRQMDAYWRAANYLPVGQIYLYDNPLLKRPLTLADLKHILLSYAILTQVVKHGSFAGLENDGDGQENTFIEQ